MIASIASYSPRTCSASSATSRSSSAQPTTSRSWTTIPAPPATAGITWTTASGPTGCSSVVVRSPSTKTLMWPGSTGRRRTAGRRSPGQRASSSSITSPTVAPVDGRPALDPRDERRQRAGQDDGGASGQDDDRLDRPDRRQRRDDRVPALAAVGAPEELSGARPEVDPDRVELVAGHRLAEHRRGGRRCWGSPAAPRIQWSPASWVRQTAALPVGHEPALLGRGQRDHPGRQRVARVGDHREAELARQAGRDVLPGQPAVRRAVLAAVVLLVEPLRVAGGHDQLVDALAGLRVWIRHEVGPDAVVARLPGRPAVARLERADRRDRHPHPVRVGRVGDDRVEDEPAGARLPRRAGGVVREALDVGPRPSAVVAPEQPGWADARVDGAVGRGHVPDRADLRAVVAVRQPVARLGPRRAEVVTPEDRRPVPRRAPAGIERARRRVAADVLNGIALARRTADLPRPSRGIRFEDERALFRTHEEQDPVRHDVLLAGPLRRPAARDD